MTLRAKLRNFRQDLKDMYETVAPVRLRRLRTIEQDGLVMVVGASAAHGEMEAGRFERDEIAIVREHLDQTDAFVDVGANIGLYACLARRAGCHTIAIEPQAKNLPLLYANLARNGDAGLEVYPVGLSDRTGLASLFGASGTGSSLIKGWAADLHAPWLRSTIPVATLDVLLGGRFAGKRLFIKIDVEGAEYDVLRGARKTLESSPRPAWLVEICLSEYHPAGLNPDYAATFEMFWDRGYEARTADAERRLVRPADVRRWVEAGRCDSGVINYLFTGP
ncbi:MAG TPA: FkbM family methyltransferase [Vicinamibacteria bacterium]